MVFLLYHLKAGLDKGLGKMVCLVLIFSLTKCGSGRKITLEKRACCVIFFFGKRVCGGAVFLGKCGAYVRQCLWNGY
jgi:hypothetical protein